MQLELVSVLIIAIIAICAAMMLYSKYDSVTILAITLVLGYVISYYGTGGSMYEIWNELGFKTNLIDEISQYYTVMTSSFLHKDLTHLLSNLVFLIMIGYPMKRRISNLMFLMFIIIGDLVGTLAYAVCVQDSPQIVIGSSIFVSSIVGAMIIMYPRLEIVLPRPIGNTRVEVWVVCILWIAMQVMQAMGMMSMNSGVAYLGHIFGFATGFLIGAVSRSKKIRWSILRPPEEHIDITKLEYLCVTDQQRSYYEKAVSNDDPEFRDAWARYLIHYIPCPKCGGEFKVVRSTFVCPNGHSIFEVNRRLFGGKPSKKDY